MTATKVSKPMKVGIFFSLANYGGVQSCVISLTKGLNRIGIEPYLLSDADVNQKIINEHDIRLHHVPIKFSVSRKIASNAARLVGGALDFLYFFKVSWLNDEYDFLYIFQPNVIVDSDLPFVYYLSMSPRAPGYSGRRWAPKAKFLAYDYLIRHFLPIYEFKEIADRCVINSKFTEEHFYRNFGSHVDVVYPSNLARADGEISQPVKDTVLFLSRIEPPKRPDMFLELAARFPTQKFVMIGGSGNQAFLRALSRRVEEQQVVNMELYIDLPHAEVVSHLQRAKFYVFTGRNEHFGITTVEAMMHGAVPFVHDSGGQREIVPWSSLRYEDEAMIEKFGKLLQLSEQEILTIRNKIRLQVEKFTEEQFISKMLTFLPQLKSN